MAKLYTVALTFLLTCAIPALSEAASLSVSPASGSYHKGENFRVDILVNSDVPINAVSGVLSFPTGSLKVLDISKKNSILNFWVEEPSFSNAGPLGNIRLEGVILNPGFTGEGGVVATVTFRAEREGSASLSFTQSAVLANDGKGTNVNASTAPGQFALLPERVLPVPVVNKPPVITQEPQVIVIKQLQQVQLPAFFSFWEGVPKWVQASILIFIGITAIVSSLVILSFGAVVVVWLWGHIWYRGFQVFAFLRVLGQIPKRALIETAHSLGMAKRELTEDIHYSTHQLAEEFRAAPHTFSFSAVIKKHISSLADIIKRFRTTNSTENPNAQTPPVQEMTSTTHDTANVGSNEAHEGGK